MAMEAAGLGETPHGTLGTVHNAASLLALLSDGPSHHPLTDLAERSGMSLPTLHRLLRSLVHAGLVEQDPATARYGLGAQLVRLSEQYVRRLPVLKVAGPFVVDLRTSTGATVSVFTLASPDVLEVDRIDGDDVGGLYRDASRARRALESAAGRVLLGHAADEEVARALAAGFDGAGGDLDVARWVEDPWVVHVPPGPTARAEVAAPVHADGEVVAALGLSAPASVLDADAIEQRYGPQLLRAATSISRALGRG